jgi:hypothetical protein
VAGEEEGIEMSDTPRTDAYNWDNGNYDDPLHAWFDFSRQLERELNAANAIIQQQQLLDEENLRLQDRIKELELKEDELNDLKKWLEGR